MSGSTRGVVSSAIGSRPGLAAHAWCEDELLYVELTDGRVVTHPLPDFVAAVSPDERGSCEVEDFGTGIWWPKLDEGIGLYGIFGVREEVIEDLAGFEKGPGPRRG